MAVTENELDEDGPGPELMETGWLPLPQPLKRSRRIVDDDVTKRAELACVNPQCMTPPTI
jgi:hypothetical protein